MPGKHTPSWKACVSDVKAKGTGNAYAICTAKMPNKGRPKGYKPKGK